MVDKKQWEAGAVNEVEFWQGWVKKYGHRYLKPRPLIAEICELIGDRDSVDIANIGSGAISLIGSVYGNVKINVHAMDFLADTYRDILDAAGVTPIAYAQKQDMTALTCADNAFDIVYCSNAIDHCIDPGKAVLEMVRVCKSGGHVILRHYTHEGKRRGYKALHQWNLDYSDGDCRFWNKTEQFLLSDLVDGFVNTVERNGKHESIISKLKNGG